MLIPSSPVAPLQGANLQAPPLSISVVVPTYNRVASLQHVIRALERQRYPSDAFEVIVVSDGSSDGTHAFLDGHRSTTMRLRWFSQHNRGPAAARNAGIDRAVGDLIVFIDDDVVPEAEFLAEHAQAHCDANREVVVLGPLLTPGDFAMAPWVRWEQEMLMKQYKAMLRGDWQATARQFYTGNASLRRRHILTAGGFDEDFRRAEDVELAYRLAALGLDFVFTMKAVGMHYAHRSYRSWLDAASAYGRNDVIFARDRKQQWLLPTIRREFQDRNAMVRLLVRLCRKRPWLASLMTQVLKVAADAAAIVRSGRVESAAYSALFGLRYYTALCNELEDPEFLFRDVTA